MWVLAISWIAFIIAFVAFFFPFPSRNDRGCNIKYVYWAVLGFIVMTFMFSSALVVVLYRFSMFQNGNPDRYVVAFSFGVTFGIASRCMCIEEGIWSLSFMIAVAPLISKVMPDGTIASVGFTGLWLLLAGFIIYSAVRKGFMTVLLRISLPLAVSQTVVFAGRPVSFDSDSGGWGSLSITELGILLTAVVVMTILRITVPWIYKAVARTCANRKTASKKNTFML